MNAPFVSIGVPVYNGENFLRDCLESIVAQSFTDFELTICDNASTDGTEAICREFVERDGRVRYHRQSHNLGAAPNYNDVYHRSRGKYFKWAAHDDLIEPKYIERCVEALDAHPESPLAYARFDTIDDNGDVIELGNPHPELCAPDVRIRAGAAIRPYIHGGASDSPIFGLMRRSALDRTRLHGSYTGSDRTLLLELALQGPFFEVPERLFLTREHDARSVRIRQKSSAKNTHAREAWFDSSRADKIVFPSWRRLGEFLSAVFRSELTIPGRARATAAVGQIMINGGWKRLAYDARVAALTIVPSPTRQAANGPFDETVR